VQCCFGIETDHGRGDAVGVRELRARQPERVGDARQAFRILVVLRTQRRVLGAQALVFRAESGRACDVGRSAAHRVDDCCDRDLHVRRHRRDGERERRRTSGTGEVKLQERDEGGHDDRPDYRE
jgi:hypothetical protein